MAPVGGPARGRAPLVPMRSAGDPGMSGPVVAPTPRERWLRRVETFGRYGVWAIPVYAVIAGLFPRSADAFSTDPARYARYLATEQGSIGDIVRTFGLGIFGVVSLVALAALLIRARGRWLALAGMLAGLAGSVLLIGAVGSVVIRDEAMRSAVLGGHVSRIAGNADVTSTLVPLGVALLIGGWMTLGAAAFAANGLSRTDGVLLILSAPMLYAGGMVLSMVPVLGAFLLLAAGLGIGLSAGGVEPAGAVTVAPPARAGQTLPALAGFADGPQGHAPVWLGDGAAPPHPTPRDDKPAGSPGARPDGVTDSTAGDGEPTASEAADAESPDRKPWRPRGAPTSWSVTRAPGDDDVVAPPSSVPPSSPPVPPSTKNRKPIVTSKRSGSILNGASVKAAGINGKAAVSGETAKPGEPPGKRRADAARRGKARNPAKPPRGKGGPDGSNGSPSGRE